MFRFFFSGVFFARFSLTLRSVSYFASRLPFWSGNTSQRRRCDTSLVCSLQMIPSKSHHPRLSYAISTVRSMLLPKAKSSSWAGCRRCSSARPLSLLLSRMSRSDRGECLYRLAHLCLKSQKEVLYSIGRLGFATWVNSARQIRTLITAQLHLN